MPRGGPRPGFGGVQRGAGRPKRIVPEEAAPRPEFSCGREFAVWALNAPDVEVPMDMKVRVALALIAADAKPPVKKPDEAQRADQEEGGIYAPRAVRGYGVVSGGRAA